MIGEYGEHPASMPAAQIPRDLEGLNLTPEQVVLINGVRATAKEISDRFSDPTDFLTVNDLKRALMLCEISVDALVKVKFP